MQNDDGMLVLGEAETTEARRPGPRGWWVFAVALVVLVASTIPFVLPDREEPSDVTEAAVEAPDEPITPPRELERTQLLEWGRVPVGGPGVIADVVQRDGQWLAVGPTSTGLGVYSWQGGSDWTARFLPAPLSLGAGLPVAHVGSSEWVVAVPVAGFPTSAATYVSPDQGETWRSVDLSGGAETVRAVDEIEGHAHAGGSAMGVRGLATPAVWRLAGDRWTEVDVEARGPGFVVGFAAAGDDSAAIGYDGDFAVWRASAGSFTPLPVSLPAGLDDVVPVEATSDVEGRAVVLATSTVDGEQRGVLLRSVDLVEWQIVDRPFRFLGTGLGRFGNSVTVLGSDRLVTVEGDSLRNVAMPSPGFLFDVESDGKVAVAGGLESGRIAAALWMTGSDVPGVASADEAPSAEWQVVVSLGRSDPGFSSQEEPSVVAANGLVFIATVDARLFAYDPVARQVEVVDRVPAVELFGAGPTVWAADEFGGTWLLEGSEWQRRRTGGDARIVAIASTAEGPRALTAQGELLALDGEWSMVSEAWDPESTSRSDVRGATGGFLARGFGRTTAERWDGTWKELEGYVGYSRSGVQFVITGTEDGITTIRPLEDLGVDEIEIPSTFPLELVAVEGQLRVRTPEAVLISDDAGRTWARHALPERLRGPAALIPTAVPALVVVADGGAVIAELG